MLICTKLLLRSCYYLINLKKHHRKSERQNFDSLHTLFVTCTGLQLCTDVTGKMHLFSANQRHVILSCMLLYLKLSKFSFLFSDFTVYVHNLYFFDSSAIFSWFAWSSCLFKVPQINCNQVWTGYWEDYGGTHCHSVSFLVLHFKTIT